jgi:hypothetical protein
MMLALGVRRWRWWSCLLQLQLLTAHAQDTLSYTNWHLVQAEEFNTDSDSSALATRWRFDYPWGRNLGGTETEYYVGQEVNSRAGILRLSAHRLATPRSYPLANDVRHLRYTSGMLYGRHTAPDSLRPTPCPPGDGVTYGLFEIRCRQPIDIASFPAFWLFGNPDEVDIFESFRDGISNNIWLHKHDYWRPGPVEEPSCQCFYFWPKANRFANEFHRYALEWLPGQLIFYFDGVPIRRETRFRPLGCGMAVITNLAIWAWMGAPADALEIDYIRLYQPRRLPAPAFGSEAAELPKSGVLRFPRATAPARSNPVGEQRWQLGRSSTNQTTLYLRDNFNPNCLSTMPLPLAPTWQGPWLISEQSTPIKVTHADTTALQWAVLDAQGHEQLAGQAPVEWYPAACCFTKLEPGAYQVRLQLRGATIRYQPLYIIDQPASSQPTQAWLQPVNINLPKAKP